MHPIRVEVGCRGHLTPRGWLGMPRALGCTRAEIRQLKFRLEAAALHCSHVFVSCRYQYNWIPQPLLDPHASIMLKARSQLSVCTSITRPTTTRMSGFALRWHTKASWSCRAIHRIHICMQLYTESIYVCSYTPNPYLYAAIHRIHICMQLYTESSICQLPQSCQNLSANQFDLWVQKLQQSNPDLCLGKLS